MKKFWDEFKAFAIKGNVIDLAVAVVIGGAFGKIVSSLVNDLLMPVLTLLTGGVNVSNLFIPLKEMDPAIKTLEAAKEAGISTLNYGMFIQAIIDFLLIAFGIFLFVKLIAKMKKKEEAAPAPRPASAPSALRPWRMTPPAAPTAPATSPGNKWPSSISSGTLTAPCTTPIRASWPQRPGALMRWAFPGRTSGRSPAWPKPPCARPVLSWRGGTGGGTARAFLRPLQGNGP